MQLKKYGQILKACGEFTFSVSRVFHGDGVLVVVSCFNDISRDWLLTVVGDKIGIHNHGECRGSILEVGQSEIIKALKLSVSMSCQFVFLDPSQLTRRLVWYTDESLRDL